MPGVAIGVRTADCIPVLLYDPVKRVVAAVHAGWKGTVLHISQKAIHVMNLRFGCNPADMRAVLGPGIGPASFQVGEEVAEHFKQADFPIDQIWSFQGAGDGSPMSGGHHIDLWKANQWLLEQAGIPKENIQVSAIDTYTTEAYFSARREGFFAQGAASGVADGKPHIGQPCLGSMQPQQNATSGRDPLCRNRRGMSVLRLD